MISLAIETYCNDCDGFEPKTVRIECDNNTDIIVRCESARRCMRMYEHLKREVKNESNDK